MDNHVFFDTHMHPIIDRIITKRIPCVFFSPHLDDAVLSCGGLIAFLAEKTPVKVVTIFTRCAPKRNTLSARAFLSQCGVDDANALFDMRRREDEEAASLVGAESVHLGYTDALWRRKPESGRFRSAMASIIPEFDHVYPTFRWHMRRAEPSSYDEQMMQEIRNDARSIVGASETVVFCPLALGRHVDHVVTNKVVYSVFPDAVAWSDFPYNTGDNRCDIEWDAYEPVFGWHEGKDTKESMIRKYETQVRAMFPEAIPRIPEKYFVKARRNSKYGQE